MARKHGKKFLAAAAKVDVSKKLGIDEACEQLKKASFAKFDESVDLAVRLGVNPKHADQMVRGAIVLPNGIGKTVRVLVFAKGDKQRDAQAAGADVVGAEELVAKVLEGWMDFDKVIATPDMMGQVGKLGRVLGPRGLMPNPKVGSVTMDVTSAVREAKAGKIEYRVDRSGIVHAPIGKVSFAAEKLAENLRTLVDALVRAKPSTAKGTYLRSITVSSTMGPGIPIDPMTAAGTKEVES